MCDGDTTEVADSSTGRVDRRGGRLDSVQGIRVEDLHRCRR